MTLLYLYMTDGCHLCDEAEALLRTVTAYRPVRWQPRDIMNDPEWLAAYGERLPVLADGQGRSLDWPFDASDILQFLEQSA
ncbi:glutaredoxin family protein [Alkalilimnicola ehrlichii]|uniref:glutaredoxin family protein n=1 Tax=Alkalilimnicola ehrlichii TaxID=351052 RepID=UPI003BA20554